RQARPNLLDEAGKQELARQKKGHMLAFHGLKAGHDNGEAGRAIAYGARQFRPPHAGKVEVGHDQIKALLLEGFKRFFHATSWNGAVAFLVQDVASHPAQHLIVVDYQDAFHGELLLTFSLSLTTIAIFENVSPPSAPMPITIRSPA